MTKDSRPGDPRGIWQTDGADTFRVSTSELRARVDRLARKTRRRNYGGLVVCAIVLACCIWWLVWLDDPLARTGAVLTIVAITTMALQLRASQGRERAPDRAALMGGTTLADFHRGALKRQRDFHRGRQLWTRMLLLVPGGLLLFAGFARAHPEVAGTIRLEALALVLFAIAAVPLNLWFARGYQRQLDELDLLQKEQP